MPRQLVIAMVGLPARGKSTIARRIHRTLSHEGVRVAVFNNGELRRKLARASASLAEFFAPENDEGLRLRDEYASMNMGAAREFLEEGGAVAILDATNLRRPRRAEIERQFAHVPLLFIECVNHDEEALEANLQRKAALEEFGNLSTWDALDTFRKRVAYYEDVYEPLSSERNRLLLDSFENQIIIEELTDSIPYYDRIRDLLTSRVVKNLYLLRHGETYFNLEDRIGGDSTLTPRGVAQARALARHFHETPIPAIFTSNLRRTRHTAEIIAAPQAERCAIIALPEFNEIGAGLCEAMTYTEIRTKMPEVAEARRHDKYGYTYPGPGGEGYATMESRVHHGLRKAFYLTDQDDNIMIVGHQAVNRLILSYFVYRAKEDVPYVYMPQNRYYHIVVTPHMKLFELRAYE